MKYFSESKILKTLACMIHRFFSFLCGEEEERDLYDLQGIILSSIGHINWF